MTQKKVPILLLNNGLKFPVLGLGTYESKCNEIDEIISFAIESGYRHFDCAAAYNNEKEIGDAIQKKINDGTVKREELFIVSKLWNTCHRPDLVIPACKKTIENLGLEYLDMYLVHWPFAYNENQQELFPSDSNEIFETSDVDYVDTWKAMEECFQLGLTKSIGVSNFNSEQIDRLLNTANIKPVANQIEVHPHLNQKKLIKFCKERNISVTAYSPFGAPKRPWAKPGDHFLDLNDPKLVALAVKYDKTVAQIILRYLIDVGTVPIPKSANKQRIKENIDVFDFNIEAEDIKIIDSMDCNGRTCDAKGLENHKYYPFNIEF